MRIPIKRRIAHSQNNKCINSNQILLNVKTYRPGPDLAGGGRGAQLTWGH